MGFEDPFNRPSACAREILELNNTELHAELSPPGTTQNSAPYCLYVDNGAVCSAIAYATSRGKIAITNDLGETSKEACLYLARHKSSALGNTALGNS